MTCEELIERYLRELRARQRSADLCKNVRLILKQFQAYCADQNLVFITDIKMEHIMSYSLWLQKKDLKATTRFAKVGCVRRWLKWATMRGHIVDNPAASWQPHTPPPPFRQVPTEAQMLSLLDVPEKTTPQGQRDRVLLEFLYGTGLRVQECADVDLADLDLCQCVLVVRCGKGEKSRCIPLGVKLVELLRSYLADIRPQFKAKPGCTALILDDRGHPMRDHCISTRVADYSKKACDTHFSVHSIRHAFATHLLQGGAPLWALQRLLGHDSLDSTFRYTHLLALDVQTELRRTHPRAHRNGGKSASQPES